MAHRLRIEPATQRFYALALFVLLQSLKARDLYGLRTAAAAAAAVSAPVGLVSELAVLLKWCVFDLCYIIGLYLARVPWLDFGPLTVVGHAVLITSFNAFVVVVSPVCLLAGLWHLVRLVSGFFGGSELSIDGEYVRVDDILRQHLPHHGKITISPLPEKIAMLDLTGASICAPSPDSNLHIPIIANTTSLRLIQYSKLDLSTLELMSYNITDKKLRKVLDNSEANEQEPWLMRLYLPVTGNGVYTLDRVLGRDLVEFQIDPLEIVVPLCPSASIKVDADLEHNKYEACSGTRSKLTVTCFGVPPMKLAYAKQYNGVRSSESLDDLRPIQLDLEEQEHLENDWSSYRWAKSYSISTELQVDLSLDGTLVYQLERLEDGLGNICNFKPVYSQNTRLVDKFRIMIIIHDRPSVKFAGCSSDKPLILIAGKQSTLNFIVDSKTPPPYDISVGYFSDNEINDGSISRLTKPTKKMQISLRNKYSNHSIERSGFYQILGIRSLFCSGHVLIPDICPAIIPPKPSISVTFEELLDRCAGSIGVNVDVSILGQPPFDLNYKIVKNNHEVMKRSVRLDRSRHQFKFTPETAGKYLYELTSIGDAHYRNVKPKDVLIWEQVVYPMAGAHFSETSDGKFPKYFSCIDSSPDLPVRLVGMGPWSLRYQISNNMGSRHIDIKDIKFPELVIELPRFNTGGLHTISLVSVEDSKGCVVNLSEPDISINVQRQKPSARFYYEKGQSSDIISSEEYPFRIPLRLEGIKPWYVKYLNLNDTNTKESILKIEDSNGFLLVNRPGIYKLTGVVDRHCSGMIDDESSIFKLSSYPQPRAYLSDIVETFKTLDPICQGAIEHFTFKLEGTSPFTIYCKVMYYDGYKWLNAGTDEFTTPSYKTQIKLRSKRTGKYRYEVIRVSDVRYHGNSSGIFFAVEQEVQPLPSAKFVRPKHVYKYCPEATPKSEEFEPVGFELSGVPPFTLHLLLNSRLLVLSNILVKNYAWYPDIASMERGHTSVSIQDIIDSVGCKGNNSKSKHITISIAEERPAVISQDSRTEYCVGEHISYQLQGSSPWVLEYIFQGTRRRATINEPIFSRVAQHPGNFSIVSVSDVASNCIYNVVLPEKRIHKLPNAVVEGILPKGPMQKGSQFQVKFELFGTPPFTITYTHSDPYPGKRQKEILVETRTITGVDAYEYTIHTSQAGSYEVVHITDKYCSNPANYKQNID